MKVSSGVKRRCTFGELIECFDNKRIPLSAQERATRKGPYRYYGAQNVVDQIDAYLFDGEYALIAEDGENLRSQKQDVAQIVEGQFWVNNHAHIIQANANADLWYLCALLNQTDISRYISGSAQPKLSQEGMRKIVVEVPDVQEQRRIGLLLRSLDRKIALNRKKIATLEKMAKEIYDYWFVQYDFPDANGRPYKSSGGEMVYSPELKREIPKGWKVSEIGCLLEIKSGYPFRSDALIENGDHSVITIKNVQEHQLDLSQLCYVHEIPDGMPEFCRIKNGACLMSLTGYVGRICRVHKDGFLLNQRVGVVIPKIESREWLYAMLGERGLKAKINYLATGCAQANVSPVDIGKIRVPLSTSELRSRYDEIAKCLMAEIFASRKECDELASLRDFLLPLLMNGQVKVGE